MKHSYGNLALPTPGEMALTRDPRFVQRMVQRPREDHQHDVPYLAGYSRDAHTIYWDRAFWPHRFLGDFDTTRTLKDHEMSEKALIDIFRLRYQVAHRVATWLEHKAVRALGVEPDFYEEYLRPFIRTADHEDIRKPPTDLDLTPYEDEHDRKILMKLMQRRRVLESAMTVSNLEHRRRYV